MLLLGVYPDGISDLPCLLVRHKMSRTHTNGPLWKLILGLESTSTINMVKNCLEKRYTAVRMTEIK